MARSRCPPHRTPPRIRPTNPRLPGAHGAPFSFNPKRKAVLPFDIAEKDEYLKDKKNKKPALQKVRVTDVPGGGTSLPK